MSENKESSTAKTALAERPRIAAQVRKRKLGEVLQERGHISQHNLTRAMQEQAGKTILLGELLLGRGLVSKDDLVAALEQVTGLRYVDCGSATVDDNMLKFVPRRVADRYCALPLCREGNKLVTVMAEPQNLHSLDELRFASGMDISPRLGFRAEIKLAIEKHYARAALSAAEEEGALPAEEKELPEIEFFTTSSRESNQEAIREFQADLRKQTTPAVRLVSTIISAAATKNASDIHIDPQGTRTVVRIRVDGILRDLMEVPSRLQESLISRIKIIADMDIAERRAPQDGRLLARVGRDQIDLRVSTLPTHYGEKVVIRLLDARSALVHFIDLGLSQEDSDLLAQMLAEPQGMLLVTGPTGSGKTTTLYAALNRLRSRTLNIITVEDPIEYVLEGINQVQVKYKLGRAFADCLRSILRQDPNVIMLGEIRDSETAEIALTAAQTGHLVLSTLHTNDSVSAITRLIDLNVPPFLVSSSVSGIIAQRLVRRLCSCRDEVAMSPEYRARLLAAGVEDVETRMYIPVGCSLCDDTGYQGRIGIYEVLVADEGICSAIRAGAEPHEIRSLARSNGMKLMQEQALTKVRMGLTSLDEVLRVVPLRKLPTSPARIANGI